MTKRYPDRQTGMNHLRLVFLLSLTLFAQEATFEVASVKPSQSADSGSHIHNDRGGFQAKNTTLQDLIRYALNAQDFQIIGAPAWITTARFDINASNDRADDAITSAFDVKNHEAQIARIRARLRHLLEDDSSRGFAKSSAKCPFMP